MTILRCPIHGRRMLTVKAARKQDHRRCPEPGCKTESWNGRIIPHAEAASIGDRRAAHRIFERTRKALGFCNSLMYSWLAHQMGKSQDDCHFAAMTARECRRAMAICNKAMREAKRR